MSYIDDNPQSPPKRRRLSPPLVKASSTSHPSQAHHRKHPEEDHKKPVENSPQSKNGNITLSATSKLADQTVAPFLAKHIPAQYAPMGGVDSSGSPKAKESSTKYCYRHRPDLKCRRQANEPSMEQLQHVSRDGIIKYFRWLSMIQELEDLSQADKQAITHVWSLFSAAPAKQRNLMLQGILTQCCFPQLSFLSANVRELIRIDFLTALPNELSFRVLCFLDTTSLCKAAQVSRSWRELADDDVVWHHMCEQHIDRKCTRCGWGLPLLERKRLRASKRQIQLRATGQGRNEWSPNITPYPEFAPELSTDECQTEQSAASSRQATQNGNYSKPENASTATADQASTQLTPPQTSTGLEESYFQPQPRKRPWKDVYKDRFMVGTNWKYGRCSIKIFKGHTNGIVSLQFDDNVLITGSYDATIKVWDLETCEEIRTLRGHDSGIRCLQFDDTKLISGSLDHTIKVWNWHTGECLSTFTGHDSGVIGLHFDPALPALLASGSADHTVKMWNFEDKTSFVLRGHTDWVNSVKIDANSRTVFSASDDGTVRLWDLDTRVCIKTFEGHVGQVQKVVTLPPEFDFEDHEHEGSDGGASTPSTQFEAPISQQATTDVSVSESFGPGFIDSSRRLPPRYILTGALDSTIRLWDTTTQKCLRTFFGHVEGVWALAADTLRIVSGAEDRTTKVWDARTGKCDRTYTGHAGPVTCLGLSDSRLCTGGDDWEVRMYCF